VYIESSELFDPRGIKMPEVTSAQAAQIVNVNQTTIWLDVKAGRLPAKLIGRRGIIRIEVNDLRKYAEDNRRLFNEDIVREFAQG
jgi:hypothetical protein